VNRAVFILLALAACSAPPPPALVEAAPRPSLAARVPKREELVCFPCHSHLKFEKGPPFAHGSTAHRKVGHCHVCHQGKGHEGREIDRTACLTCHGEGSEALRTLARNERKSK
jgi:hypothetical protein